MSFSMVHIQVSLPGCVDRLGGEPVRFMEMWEDYCTLLQMSTRPPPHTQTHTHTSDVDYDAIEYDPTVMENELDGFSSCLRFSKGLVQLFSGVYVYAFFVCMCLCVCHQRLRRSPHNTHARYIHTGTTVLVMIPLAFLTCFHWYLRKCVVCVCVCVCVNMYACVPFLACVHR